MSDTYRVLRVTLGTVFIPRANGLRGDALVAYARDAHSCAAVAEAASAYEVAVWQSRVAVTNLSLIIGGLHATEVKLRLAISEDRGPTPAPTNREPRL